MRYSSTGRAKSLAGKVPLAFTGSRGTIPEAQRTEQQTGVTRVTRRPSKGLTQPRRRPAWAHTAQTQARVAPGSVGPKVGSSIFKRSWMSQSFCEFPRGARHKISGGLLQPSGPKSADSGLRHGPRPLQGSNSSPSSSQARRPGPRHFCNL